MKNLIVLLVIFSAALLSGAEDFSQSVFDILYAENTLYLRINSALKENNVERVKYLTSLLPHAGFRILHCYTDGDNDAGLQAQNRIFDYYNRQYLRFLSANPELLPSGNRVMIHTVLYLDQFAADSDKPTVAMLLQKYPAAELKDGQATLAAITLECSASTLSSRNKFLLAAMLLQNYQNFLAFLPLIKDGDYPLLQTMVLDNIVLNQHQIDEIVRLRPDLAAKNEYQKYLTELKKATDATPGATAPGQGNQP